MCPGGEHVCSLWRELCTCHPVHLWGSRAPTTGLTVYANVRASILQGFLCVCSPGMAGTMGGLAALERPRRGWRSSGARARPQRTCLEACPAPAACDLDDPTPHPTLRTWWTPQAVNVCHVHGPHTTPSARHTRQSGDVSRCPSLLRRACDGAEGLRACAGVCTYGRNPRVPTGEAPVYLREKQHALTLYF